MTTENGVITVPLDAIAPSKTNPRKHFEPGALKELADNIREIGILQPLLVRVLDPNPVLGERAAAMSHGKKVADYELVFGERRWRAARTAGLAQVPVIVRPLDDKQVLELQVVENLQRQDLTPIEEADGYQRLVKQHGYTVEDLAAKIGKSKSHVYARMKLLSLCTPARAALESGKLAAEVALLIARIPDPKLQKEALEHVLESDWDGPMTYRAAKDYIHGEYMLRLSEAQFDIKDADLLPSAGTCAACPKRTGNQKELFADVDRADVCTDPKCFEQKKQAWIARELERAKSAGQEVHGPEEAKKFFNYQRVKGAEFVDLADRCDMLGYGHDKAWGATLGKLAPPPILAVDDEGQIHKLVARSDAKAALKATGLTPKAESRATDYDAQNRKHAAEKKRLSAIAQQAVTAMLPRLVEQLRDNEASLWRRIAERIDERNDIDVDTFIARRRGLAETQTQARAQIDKWWKAEHTVEELQAYVIESLLGARWGSGWHGGNPVFGKEFKELCQLGGVDLKKLEKDQASPAAKGKAKKSKGGKR